MDRKPPHARETPSQTAGPFLHIGLTPHAAGFPGFAVDLGTVIAEPDTQGTRIRVEGRVLDGAGAPLTDILIEVWQADAQGRYNHPEGGAHSDGNPASRPNAPPAFKGWGRVIPDPNTGIFSFETIKPGPVPDPAHGPAQAPHLNLWLVARGINLGLSTRMYFADEAAANATDPVLALIATPPRRQTLIASHESVLGSGTPIYCFDIHLQGASETVFFDI